MLTLSEFSDRQVHRHILHRENGRTVLQDTEYGGPQDHTDRRMMLDVDTLETMLKVARTSATQRCVVHKIGVRAILLREDDTGHRWEEIHMIGLTPRPEVTDLTFRVG